MEDMKWRKASRSNSNGELCVELARVPGSWQVAMRDSKEPTGPQHRFSVAQMAAFFKAVRQGKYDL